MELRSLRHRPSLTSLDANIETAPSSPGSRGSSNYGSCRSHKGSRVSLSGVLEQYQRPAVAALVSSIGAHLKSGQSTFEVRSSDKSLEHTCLVHTRGNHIVSKISAAVISHFEARGFYVKIELEENIESGFINMYKFSVQHASMRHNAHIEAVSTADVKRLSEALDRKTTFID